MIKENTDKTPINVAVEPKWNALKESLASLIPVVLIMPSKVATAARLNAIIINVFFKHTSKVNFNLHYL